MWIERRLRDDPDFPHPIYFGRIRMWDEDLLDKWDDICAARGRCEYARCRRVTLSNDPETKAARPGPGGG
jgi:hypothetical protein